LQKQPFFVKFGANTSKLNNFTAPRGRYFYTQKQFIPNVVGNEHSGRRKDRNMNNRRIFIGLQHFAEGEGDGGASATAHRQV
jgi:hypothetical protein